MEKHFDGKRRGGYLILAVVLLIVLPILYVASVVPVAFCIGCGLLPLETFSMLYWPLDYLPEKVTNWLAGYVFAWHEHGKAYYY